MKTELIQTLTATFEGHAQLTENGVEYWLARDLQHLLGYAEWRNFHNTAISKARTACEVSGHSASDHFVDVNKTIQMPKGAEKEHVANNEVVRNTLLERGIHPESLPADEDVKKVERRLASEEKKSLKNPEALRTEDA